MQALGAEIVASTPGRILRLLQSEIEMDKVAKAANVKLD